MVFILMEHNTVPIFTRCFSSNIIRHKMRWYLIILSFVASLFDKTVAIWILINTPKWGGTLLNPGNVVPFVASLFNNTEAIRILINTPKWGAALLNLSVGNVVPFKASLFNKTVTIWILINRNVWLSWKQKSFNQGWSGTHSQPGSYMRQTGPAKSGGGWVGEGGYHVRATEQWNHILDTAVVPPNQQNKLTNWVNERPLIYSIFQLVFVGLAALTCKHRLGCVVNSLWGCVRIWETARWEDRLAPAWPNGPAKNFPKQNIVSPQ